MRITDLLSEKGIKLDAKPQSKAEAIDQLVELMNSTGNLKDKAEYKKCVLAREEEGTTGIGEGVAIPHVRFTLWPHIERNISTAAAPAFHQLFLH